MHRTTWRVAWLAAAAAALMAGVLAAPASGQSRPPDPATPAKVPLGSADAGVGRFTAYAGNYQLNISAGVARAALENQTTKAQSAFIDYGILAALLSTLSFPTVQKLGVPPEAVSAFKSAIAFPTPAAVSTSGGASDIVRDPALPGAGKTALHLGPAALGTGPEEAHVAKEPLTAMSRSSVGSVDLAGFADGGGGVATATVDRNEASAVTSLGELRFSTMVGGPPVAVFRGLEWHAHQRRADKGPEVVDAGFAMGSAEVAGQSFHFDTPEEFAAAVDPINSLLAGLQTGLRLEAPKVERSETGVQVTPFAVDVRNSVLLKSTFGALWSGGLASVVTEAELATAQGVPETGLVFTIANVVLGVAAGSGGVRLQFGGVSTSLGERDAYVEPDTGTELAEEPTPAADVTADGGAEAQAAPLAGAVPAISSAESLAVAAPLAAAPGRAARAVAPRTRAVAATSADAVASPWGVVAAALAAVGALAALDEVRLRRPARRRG